MSVGSWVKIWGMTIAKGLLDGPEGSNAEVLTYTDAICKHDYKYNEEILIFCRSCGSVERIKWHKEEKQCSGKDTNEQKSKQKVYKDDNNDMFLTHSNDPHDEPLSKSWKTFLNISFLVNYLKLFLWKRPLILVIVPVYLIHNSQFRRGSTAPKLTVLPGVPRPSGDVKHVLDCLALKRSQETKFAHKNYMAKTLRESPGIFILDEAHNPRMRRELDSKYLRRGNGEKKAHHLLEARPRKFFMENIARKINSHNEEKIGNSSDTPPVEILITLGSIHPWLIKTATTCAYKFFAKEELKRLERIKFNLRKISKIKFGLSLISPVVKNEEVLIFYNYLVLLLTGNLDLFERGKVIDKFEDSRSGSKILLVRTRMVHTSPLGF
ncbi:chromatin remodeling protein, putative [Medicago truncatula]|uniref:Chromatin remodeling protein, putative n=1 Tax=Medicago truncatula TaxID=3880 RepID=G7L041_MEDTR|nr:chromatin remodeling protein, putative [Medicago truncatula]